MGIAGSYSNRRIFFGTIHENSDVDGSSSVERSCVRGKCCTVWTDSLLFYGTVFPPPGIRDRPARIPNRRPWSEWWALVRFCDPCGWRFLVVVRGKSVREISYWQELN